MMLDHGLPDREGEGYTAEERKAEPIDGRKFRPVPLGNVDSEPDPGLFSVLVKKAEGNLLHVEVCPGRREPRPVPPEAVIETLGSIATEAQFGEDRIGPEGRPRYQSAIVAKEVTPALDLVDDIAGDQLHRWVLARQVFAQVASEYSILSSPIPSHY